LNRSGLERNITNTFHDPPLNPYEAPQTTDLQSSTATTDRAAAETWALQPRAPLPPSVERWLKAALVVYLLSFIVPLAPWANTRDAWEIGYGLILFIWGIAYCWHPMFIAWWANVFFGLSIWKTRHHRPGLALVFALLSVLTAGSFGFIFGHLDHASPGAGKLPYILPYFCWFGAMSLQAIAAWKLRKSAAETAISRG